MQPGELIARSLGEDFDAAVVIIAYPSPETEDVGLAFDKPTETDALDAAADEKAASLDRLVG